MKKVLLKLRRYSILLCISSFLLLQVGCANSSCCANKTSCCKSKTSCLADCQKACCQKDAKKACDANCSKACCKNEEANKEACGPNCQKACCKK